MLSELHSKKYCTEFWQKYGCEARLQHLVVAVISWPHHQETNIKTSLHRFLMTVTDISKEHRRAEAHAEATVDIPQSQKGLVLTRLASKQPQELPRIKENKDGNATI